MKVPNQKLFISILSQFHKDKNLLIKYADDKRLTQVEKKVLQAWWWLREAKFEQILSELSVHLGTSDELVLSQLHLILGITYNNSASPREALNHLQQAKNYLAQFEKLDQLKYSNEYNLFIIGTNLKNQQLMASALDGMGDFLDDDSHVMGCYHLCEFIFLKFGGQYDKAQQKLSRLKEEATILGPGFNLTLLIEEFDFQIKLQYFDRAAQLLQKIKKYRTFHFGANYKFMDILINYLTKKTPIYAYDKHFKHYPLLHNQIMVLKYLSTQELSEAKKHWIQLQTINPQIYQTDFQYQADPCLFSEVLKNLLSLRPASIQPQHQEFKTLEEKIAYLFQLNSIMSRDELFVVLWPKEIPNKVSYNKLSKLISRTNTKFNLQISFSKGVYKIHSQKKIA